MSEDSPKSTDTSAMYAWQTWLLRHYWWVGLTIGVVLMAIRRTGLSSPVTDFGARESIWLATLAGMPPFWMWVIESIALNPFSSRSQFKLEYRNLSYVVTVFWLMSCLGVFMGFYWTYVWQSGMFQYLYLQPGALAKIPNSNASFHLPLLLLSMCLMFAILPLVDRSRDNEFWSRKADQPIRIRRAS